MNKWKCCVTEPPETGKKVLCHQKGDIYVCIRLGKVYVPMPFADHYFSPNLSTPETWCEIDFPEGLTGHTRLYFRNAENLITLSEAEVDHPQIFKEYCDMVIGSMGKAKRP